ncbi:hemolysin family protein [Actinomadura verrucosospora]|uniref:Magnesium and cobalt efflux protein CorC n=1 Tax=Actinomadura verrucosospora TaxID=46165 RepID=A0A7D3W2V9_ACTVE|nr:hemolysin family protein [Actinomadura verrucosospora]QKG24992.1 magnesium and cobalt efflux protein CorC [Actinomadura verrucosospora]
MDRTSGTEPAPAPAAFRPPGRLARPLVWLLSTSTDLVVRLAGGDPNALREELTAERMRALVAENTQIAADERALIEEVFAAGERPLREVLVPRTEVVFLDAAMPLAAAARAAAGSPHSRFPVCRGSHDEVIGFVHIRDLLVPEDRDGAPADGALADGARPVGSLVRPVKFLPASQRVLPVLSEMRREGCHLAIVMDEYGGVAGIVTLEDLMEELIGDIRDEYDVQDAQARRLHGGVVEVDGLLNLDDFAAETGIRLPAGPYETVAGHIMAVLGRVPAEGDSVRSADRELRVARMEGRRVARVRVTPRAAPQAAQQAVRPAARWSARPAVRPAVPATPVPPAAAPRPAGDAATGGGASDDT